jgi:hypothetical protein
MQSFESEPRAAAPRTPEPTRGQVRALAAFKIYRAERERIERRSTVRGLILLAVVVAVGRIARAGLDRVFVQGWWRP